MAMTRPAGRVPSAVPEPPTGVAPGHGTVACPAV